MTTKKANKVPDWFANLFSSNKTILDKKTPVFLNLGSIEDFKGEAGQDGKKGDKGDRGERGPQGPQGPRGLQGKQGEKGDKGDPGETGKDGERGLEGKMGPMPKHETEGNKIRFEIAPNKWGDWIKVQTLMGSGLRGGGNLATKDDAQTSQLVIFRTLLNDDYTGFYGTQTNDGDGNPTLIEIYADAGKTDLLFTKEITWTSGNPTEIVITDKKSGAVFTSTATFDASGNRETFSEILS